VAFFQPLRHQDTRVHQGILYIKFNMKKLLSIFTFLMVFVTLATAQFQRMNQDSIRKITQADHKMMMDLIGVTSIRPGPSGTAGATNSANYDEARATQYTSLPDPLVLNNGKPVKTAKVWWGKRRPEIKELFDREIYGRVPANVPKVTWELVKTSKDSVGKFLVITKKLIGHVDNSIYPSIKVDIDLTLVTPAGGSQTISCTGGHRQTTKYTCKAPGTGWSDLAAAGFRTGMGLCHTCPGFDTGR
jgi:hypothetical protein